MASTKFGNEFFPELNLAEIDPLDRFKLHPAKQAIYSTLIDWSEKFLFPKVDTLSSATLPANSLGFEEMLLQATIDSDLDYSDSIIIDRDPSIVDRFDKSTQKHWNPRAVDLFNLSGDEVVELFLPHNFIWLDLMCLFDEAYYNLVQNIIKSAIGDFIIAFTTVRYQSWSATRLSTSVLGVMAR